MKSLFQLITLALFIAGCSKPTTSSLVVSTDIDHFWEAYDKVQSTEDTVQQKEYLQKLFLDKGTPGLSAIMEARRYTLDSYLDAIHDYPNFWASMRTNMNKAKELGPQIEEGIAAFEKLYPDQRPAKVYFTVGALRTNGTAMDSLVLIGSELALADENVVTDELPSSFDYLRAYFDGNPINDVVFLNVHEYVHTQQTTHGGYDLLSQCLFEGIAEFIPVIAMKQESPTPAIAYGKANDSAIQEVFVKEMFSPFYNNWIWNNTNNVFATRDLGYYVGYAIAEQYYEGESDKRKAIANLLELDFTDTLAIEHFVDQVGYFSQPIAQLKSAYEASRPTVTSIAPLETGNQGVDPSIQEFTITFSEPMDTRYRNFQYGPLGEKAVLGVQGVIGFSEDERTISLSVAMEAGQRYQLIVGEGFRTKAGIPLQPYLIDFRTAK